jgi:hypothetical protein
VTPEEKLHSALTRARKVAEDWHKVQGHMIALVKLIDPELPPDELLALRNGIGQRLLESADTCTEMAASIRIMAADMLRPE